MSVGRLDIQQALRNEVNPRLDTANDKLSDIQTKLTQPTYLKSTKVTIDNSTGTSDLVQALFSTSTPSRYATICRDPNDLDTIYVGDANAQEFPLNPGDCIQTAVSDLSMIYVKVPVGVTANLYVLYET